MPSGFKTTWRKFFIEYEDFGHTECAIECGISLKLEIEKTAQAFLSILAPVWIMLLTIVTMNSLSTILMANWSELSSYQHHSGKI